MSEEKKDALRGEFSGLLDNELDAETRATVEAELAKDADLLRELQALKKVDALYRALPRHAAPENFEARVHAALAENVVPINRFRKPVKWFGPLLAFAATLLLISGVYYQVQKNAPQSSFTISQAPQQTETESAAKEKAAVDAKSPERQRMDNAEGISPVGGAVANEQMKTDALEVDTQDAAAVLPEPVLAEKKQLAVSADDDEMNGRINAPASLPSAVAQADNKPLMKAEAGNEGDAGKSNATPPPLASAPLPLAAEGVSVPRDMREELPQAPAPEMESPAENNAFGMNSLALGAAMKDEDKGALRRLQSTESPVEYFRMLKEHRARTKEMHEGQEQIAPRNVGGRKFVFEQAVWVESDYRDEAVEYVEKGSDEYNALAEKHIETPEISGLGDYVLAQFGETWYFIYDLNNADN